MSLIIVGISCLTTFIEPTLSYNYLQCLSMKQQDIAQLFNSKRELSNKLIHKRVRFLCKIPFFSLAAKKKGKDSLQIIAASIHFARYDPGELIYSSEQNRKFNYVLEGNVTVFTSKKGPEGQPNFFKRMGPHEHFGERISYNKEALHSAKAASKASVLSLNLSVFNEALAGYLARQQLTSEACFLSNIWLFDHLKIFQLQRILQSSERLTMARNHIAFKENTLIQHIWVVVQGQLTFYVRDLNSTVKYKPFFLVGKGEVCGLQFALDELLTDFGAVCTCQNTVVWKIHLDLLQKLITEKLQTNFYRGRKETIRKQRERVILFQANKHSDQEQESVSSEQPKYLKKPKLTRQSRLLKESRMSNQSRQSKQYKEFKGWRSLKHKQQKVNHEPAGSRYSTKEEDSQDQMTTMQRSNIMGIEATMKNTIKFQWARDYKLLHIREKQAEKFRKQRLSTYSNHSLTNDKQLFMQYLSKKEQRYKSMLLKEQAYLNLNIPLVKCLHVHQSNAIKHQKRKIRLSRKLIRSSINFDH